MEPGVLPMYMGVILNPYSSSLAKLRVLPMYMGVILGKPSLG